MRVAVNSLVLFLTDFFHPTDLNFIISSHLIILVFILSDIREMSFLLVDLSGCSTADKISKMLPMNVNALLSSQGNKRLHEILT